MLLQHSVQQSKRPGGLQRAFLSARSLSALDDGGDCNGFPLLQGGLVHGESLAGVADVAVIHLEVDLAGSRQDQCCLSCLNVVSSVVGGRSNISNVCGVSSINDVISVNLNI